MKKAELQKLARVGLEAEIARLNALLKALNRRFGRPEIPAPRRRRKPLSRAARKAISEAQKARWAKKRDAATSPPPQKKKGTR